MLFSYIATVLAAATAVLASPAPTVEEGATEVKRQVIPPIPSPTLYGPFRLRFVARWVTYRNKYAYASPPDIVRPAPSGLSGSIFNYENSTGRLWLGSNFTDPVVGGLRLNLTSNLAPLAFGPLGRPSCDSRGGIAYETSFSFNSSGFLSLAGYSLWRGCSTSSSIGQGPGINFQFGSGPATTPDCQDVYIQYERVVPA